MKNPTPWAGLAAALLTAATGCSLDLGEAPFLCHPGTPECPAGYECSGKVCVREGSGYLPADSGVTPKKDGPVTKKDGPVLPPDKGPIGPVKILITEFMANPAKVSDTNGEWLELFNPGNVKVNINGWTLKDKGVDSQKIAHKGPLYVPAKGFLVLGRSTNQSQNGGVPVAYAYGAFFLSNTGDEVILENERGQVIDSFTYTASLSITSGASLSVKTPGANKNLPSSWCTETTLWKGSSGDKGTPLAKTGCK